MVRVDGVAKLPLVPAAGPPQLWMASSAQPPRRARPKPSTWPHIGGPAASLTTAKVAASCPHRIRSSLILLLLEPPWQLLICLWGWWLYNGHLPLGLLTGGQWLCPISPPSHLGPRTTTWATWACPLPAQGTCRGATPPAAEDPLLQSSSSSSSSIGGSAVASPPSLACSTSYPSSISHTHWKSRGQGALILSSMGSAFVTHSLGTGSPAYQCPPQPPQLGHGHVASPFWHGSNTRALGQGTT